MSNLANAPWRLATYEEEKPTLFEVQPNRKQDSRFDSIADAFHYFMDQIYDGDHSFWGIAKHTDGTYTPMSMKKYLDLEDAEDFIQFSFQHDYSTDFYNEAGDTILSLKEGE